MGYSSIHDEVEGYTLTQLLSLQPVIISHQIRNPTVYSTMEDTVRTLTLPALHAPRTDQHHPFPFPFPSHTDHLASPSLSLPSPPPQLPPLISEPSIPCHAEKNRPPAPFPGNARIVSESAVLYCTVRARFLCVGCADPVVGDGTGVWGMGRWVCFRGDGDVECGVQEWEMGEMGDGRWGKGDWRLVCFGGQVSEFVRVVMDWD